MVLWRALILLLQNASCTCEVNVAKKEAAFVNRDDQLVGNSWEKFRYLEFFEDKTTILFLFFGPLNFNLKRIKYEIRLGEPNRPMSMGPKKVEPILCVGPLTEWRPSLAHHVSNSWRLALQGKDLGCKKKTCSTRRRLALQGGDLLYKALQGGDLLCKEETCSTRKGGQTSLL